MGVGLEDRYHLILAHALLFFAGATLWLRSAQDFLFLMGGGRVSSQSLQLRRVEFSLRICCFAIPFNLHKYDSNFVFLGTAVYAGLIGGQVVSWHLRLLALLFVVLGFADEFALVGVLRMSLVSLWPRPRPALALSLSSSFAEPVIFFVLPGLHGSASRYGQSCEGWCTRRDSVRKSGSAYAVFVPLCIKFTPQAPGTWCFFGGVLRHQSCGLWVGSHFVELNFQFLIILTSAAVATVARLLPCWCTELSISDHDASSRFPILPRH